MPTGLRVVGSEKLVDQRADQLGSFLRTGLSDDRAFKTLGIPTRINVSKIAVAASPAERAEKSFVAHLLSQVLSVSEQSFCQVHPWNRSIRMRPPHEIHVAAEDARLHVVGTDHVVGH